MKVLACVSGGFLSTALLKKLADEGYRVTAFWVDFGAGYRSPVELCASHGVELHTVDLRKFSEMLPEQQFPGRNGVVLALALSFAAANGYEAVGVGFCRQHEYSDAEAHYLASVEASIGLIGLKVILLRPFATWARLEVEKLVAKPKPPEPEAIVCHAQLKCANKAKEGYRVSLRPNQITCPLCREKLDLDTGPASVTEAGRRVYEKTIAAAPPAPKPSGTLRPFIFSAEIIYGYVNDRTSFDHVANQAGSPRVILTARMVLPQDNTTPMFTPDGVGETVEEWLGPAISSLVDVVHLTTPKGGGHNPGHVGCC